VSCRAVLLVSLATDLRGAARPAVTRDTGGVARFPAVNAQTLMPITIMTGDIPLPTRINGRMRTND
jgi:hypothetical protein